MLSEDFRAVVGVPDYYVDEYNATTMINFWPVIAEFADAFQPETICEIGSERGLTSERLSALLPNVRIHVVDPVVSARVKAMPNVDAHEELSERFLSRGKRIPFYLIDGDHNYETVSMEIRRAVENAGDGPFCAMFHDVGWPFARRDGYYSPALVSAPREHRFNSYLDLETTDLKEGRRGFETGEVFALAATSGGPRNGVLTAIEDFVKAGDGWRLVRLPIFYGMAVLWREDGLSQTVVSRLRGFESFLNMVSPMLSSAEANRLRLFQGLAETRHDLDRELRKEVDFLRIPKLGYALGRLRRKFFGA